MNYLESNPLLIFACTIIIIFPKAHLITQLFHYLLGRSLMQRLSMNEQWPNNLFFAKYAKNNSKLHPPLDLWSLPNNTRILTNWQDKKATFSSKALFSTLLESVVLCCFFSVGTFSHLTPTSLRYPTLSQPKLPLKYDDTFKDIFTHNVPLPT